MLRLEELKAAYGRSEVLHGISLDVEPGETACLIGANGAGKSTTMAAISGLLRPVRGKILFEGKPIEGQPADRVVGAGISLVPEGRRVFMPLTVLENLEMGAYRRHRLDSREEIQRDLELVYSIFPVLKERQRQFAGTLSGGEQQMLAIGRALMCRPKLLMLDEPSMGLAPLMVKEIFRVIVELGRQGLTILIAEQNARMALRVSKRGYIIQSGRVVQCAEARTLLQDESVREAYLGV